MCLFFIEHSDPTFKTKKTAQEMGKGGNKERPFLEDTKKYQHPLKSDVGCEAQEDGGILKSTRDTCVS